ncbi:MAG: hypothetical protein RR274_02725 [Erysipelotrichaceae bacterium]
MNNKRRKAISEINEQLEVLSETLNIVNEEETEYLDNMPENLQESEKYNSSEEIIDIINEIIENLDNAISVLNEVVSK